MGRKVTRSDQTYHRHPFLSSPEELYQQLSTDPESGLSPAQAQESLRRYGLNKLDGDAGISWQTLLFKQMSNAMILVMTLYIPPIHSWLTHGRC